MLKLLILKAFTLSFLLCLAVLTCLYHTQHLLHLALLFNYLSHLAFGSFNMLHFNPIFLLFAIFFTSSFHISGQFLAEHKIKK